MAYAYDAWGNRVSRTGWDGVTTTTERFAVDGWDTAKPGAVGTENFDIWADLDTSNTVTSRRLFGAGFDDPEARVAGSAVTWYAADLTGSVRRALDGARAVTHSAAYDAFGNLTSGTLPDRYGYAGREREGVDGSYHNRDRVYRPEVGRFLSEDPEGLAPDVNPYRYAHNQPTTYRDPSGRDIYAQSVGDEGPEVTLETWLRSIERRARELAGYGPPSEKGIDKGEPGPPKPPSPFAQRHDKTLGGNSREEREAEARSDGNTGFAIGAAVVTAPIWVPFLGEFVLLQGGRWVVVQGANLGRAGVAAAPRVIDWGARAGNTVAPWVVQGEIVTGPGLSLPAFAIFGMKFGGIQRPWTLFGMHAGRGAPKHPPGGQGCPPPKDGPAAGPANGGAGNPGAVPPAKPAAPPPVQVPAPAAPAAPGAPKLPGVTVKEGKWDYFFGRVKSNPDNEARSLQNMKDLETLGIKEAEGGQAKLLKLFEEGKGLPEAGRHTTEYGVTITRTVKVGEKGAIDVKYFYPGGDLTATPEVSTIIPKIFK